MPIDTEPASQRIETGRSWRDLPPTPPNTAPLRPHPDMSPVALDPPRPSLPWTRIGAGVLALAVGIAVGAWAPWSEPGGEAEPLAADGLPETIVPDTPQELVPVPSQDPFANDPFAGAPEDFPTPEQFFDQLPQDFLDQLPDDFLEQLPPGFFEGLPDGPSIDTVGLIGFSGLPDGYQVRSNVSSSSNDSASQRIRLLGPEGPVDVQAIRAAEVALPDTGDRFTAAGVEGRIEGSAGVTTISWLAEPDLLITVEATSDIRLDTLTEIVVAVEVRG